MTDSIDDILHWLQVRPFQDNPTWVEKPIGLMSSTWDEWIAKGRRIPDLESGLIWILEHNKDPLYRSAAALALGFVGAGQAIKPLIRVLRTDVPMVSMEAAASLGRVGNPEAIMPLCDALRSTDSNVRANACTALGRLGGEKALSCLKAAEKDKDLFVQAAAREALERSK